MTNTNFTCALPTSFPYAPVSNNFNKKNFEQIQNVNEEDLVNHYTSLFTDLHQKGITKVASDLKSMHENFSHEQIKRLKNEILAALKNEMLAALKNEMPDYGFTESTIVMFEKYFLLTFEYSLALSNSTQHSLSEDEINLLNKTNTKDYADLVLTNSMGLKLHNYAVLLNDLNVMKELHAKNILSFDDISYSDFCFFIAQIANTDSQQWKNLLVTFPNFLNTLISLTSDSGENALDFIFEEEPLLFKELITEAGIDIKILNPIYKFLIPDSPSRLNEDEAQKINIAIVHDYHYSWSTDVINLAKAISKTDENYKFYIVNKDATFKGGEEFFKQFNGWINPGGMDTYPKDMNEFISPHWESDKRNSLEQTYQYVSDMTYKLKIPLLGMCAGAQNLALYHEGTVQPVSGYFYPDQAHTIHYKKGTLGHYMTLNKQQKDAALKNCEFPEVAFKGVTAHLYAAKASQLGNFLELGAVSEEGVAMSFSSTNGLQHVTQFHPEEHYSENIEINHEKEWIDSFLHLAAEHKRCQDGSCSIEDNMMAIKNRLAECVEEDKAVIDEFYNAPNSDPEFNYSITEYIS